MALGHDGYPIRDSDRVVSMTRTIDGHARFEVFCLDYWRRVVCHGSPSDSTLVLHAHGTGPLESDMFLDIEVMCAEDHSLLWKRVVNIQRAWRRHACSSPELGWHLFRCPRSQRVWLWNEGTDECFFADAVEVCSWRHYGYRPGRTGPLRTWWHHEDSGRWFWHPWL